MRRQGRPDARCRSAPASLRRQCSSMLRKSQMPHDAVIPYEAETPHEMRLPHEALDFSRRAELTELMDEPCSRDVHRACLRDLARVNRWFLGYRPVLRGLEGISRPPRNEPLRILDVGCGYGDGLRGVEQWAHKRRMPVELTGLDLNPDTIAIAREATAQGS